MTDRNLNKIYNLTMNMLAFSKEREPRLATSQVNKIIEEAVETVHHLADQRSVMLLTDLDEKMPPIPVDEDGLQQVVMNLASNAVEAVNEGEGRVVVRTEFEPQREIIRVTVSDNGPGIPLEHIQRIFEPFYSTKGQGGTGLGLAVAKKIIEEHHGRINVTSGLGEGTTFEIQLPAGMHRWTPDSETQDTIHLP
jgi:signal transduction histidine kinase